MGEEIDVANAQGVCASGDQIGVLIPRKLMSKREALVHAAWLVVLADDDSTFWSIVDAVREL